MFEPGLKPGDLVGPYEIRGFLGQGGMGTVYRAFDPRLERTVALKVIVAPEPGRAAISGASHEEIVAEAEGRLAEVSARLFREARSVASLSHPNVVAIYDVGETRGLLYLAMEYVVGSTLRSLVGDADVPIPRRVRWLVDVARALDAAHKGGIVHRDVKPENVMVRDDGVVKVLDFGIARRTVSGKPDDQHAVDTLTGGGSIAGTPVYMAPEQIRGGDVDARCDQFAWGVMAFELLSGHRPWPETGDVFNLVARILTDPAPALRAKVPDAPAVLEETIARALSKEPDARFPTMADVAEAIEGLAVQSTGGERVRISAGTPREEPSAFAATTRLPDGGTPAPETRGKDAAKRRTKRTRRRAAQLALPLVLLGAVVALTVLVLRRPRGPGPATGPRPLSTVDGAETAYREAMARWRDGAMARSRAALTKAIELDPTFAAAHLELAVQTSTDDPAAAQQSFQRAFDHRAMLVARDAALLEASEPYVRPKPDLAEWETRMTAVVFQHPRDPELQFYLGRARERRSDDDGAKQAYEAAVRLDGGFVPALAALANVERNLGHDDAALSATERCLKQSPVATTCVELRYRIFSDSGQCARARDEARAWSQLDQGSPAAFEALARALHATGAPRPSVEEALSRAWAARPAESRAREETWDRIHLALLDGDLARADELARKFDAALPATADAWDRAQPARVRMNVLLEQDKREEAADVAEDFLGRAQGFTPYPFAPDQTFGFYEPLYRAKRIPPSELAAQREKWLDAERARLSTGRDEAREEDDAREDKNAWPLWMVAWGALVETREEANDALAHLPPERLLPQGDRRSSVLDFNLGKTLVLAGRANDALPRLQRATETCSSFDDGMRVVRGLFYLGQAYEAKGELAAARASYGKVLAAWPKTDARTTKSARARLRALGGPTPP